MANKSEQQFGSDWTESKLSVIEKYLNAFVVALKNKKFQLRYIDAFAGTGENYLKNKGESKTENMFEGLSNAGAQEFIEGSVLRSLNVAIPFDSYEFIELDPKKCERLEEIRAKFPDKNIHVLNDDANTALPRIAREWTKNQRGVVFLDPYGMQVTWDTISCFSKTPGTDLWFLFPLMGASRHLKRSGQFSQEWERRLDRIFGTSEWKDEFYRKSGQKSLFNDSDEDRIKVADFDLITDYFVKRLSSVYGKVAKPAMLKNSNGTPIFALVFCTSATGYGSTLARKIAGDILRKI